MASSSTIHTAAERGTFEDFQRYIDENPQVVDCLDQHNQTPLHYAARRGSLRMVTYLLESGADVNRRFLRGTALHSAVMSSHLDVVRLLLKRGAAVSITDSNGWTPLLLAVWLGRSRIVDLLLKHDIFHNLTNTSNDRRDLMGRNAVYLSCLRGYAGITEMVIKAGGDPGVRACDGTVAVDVAVGRPHRECAGHVEAWQCAYLFSKARRLRDAAAEAPLTSDEQACAPTDAASLDYRS